MTMQNVSKMKSDFFISYILLVFYNKALYKKIPKNQRDFFGIFKKATRNSKD
jgi:hypothetical protein